MQELATTEAPAAERAAPQPARERWHPVGWLKRLGRLSPRSLVTLGVVGAAVGFVLWQLRPDLVAASTTPAGGDMGAHVLAPAFLRDHLLPHLRLTGWSNAWYGGFPLFVFYFPLPSLAIVALDVLLPYGVAFKVIAVAGAVTLPLAAWAFGRLADLRWPAPALLAVATVPFLFDRSFTIDGGNIPSTLAGEFAMSISLSIALVYLGVVSRGLRTGRHRALAAGLLAVTGLTHVVPAFFALAGSLVILVVTGPTRRRLQWLVPVLVVAGLTAAFWVVPFILRIGYTTDMGWEKVTTYKESLFPFLAADPGAGTSVGLVALGLAVLGAIGAVVWRRRTSLLLVAMAAASAVGFVFAPQSRLYNARLRPFWFLCVYLLAALGVVEVGRAVAWLLAIPARRQARRAAAIAAADRSWAWHSDVEAPLFGLYPFSAPEGEAAGDGGPGSNGQPVGDGHDGVGPARAPRIEARLPTVSAWHERLALGFPVAALVAVVLAIGVPLRAVPGWLPVPQWDGGPKLVRASSVADDSFIPDWVAWNFSGYERKEAYPEYKRIVDTMGRLPCGRAFWEYENGLDRYGTPMALMLLPYWTDGCIDSMEGLFFESSASTPYHFLNQAELSNAPSSAMRDLPYRSLDVTAGVDHLKLLGVRYYMAFSEEALTAARANPDLTLVAKSVPWEVFEVRGSELVEPLRYRPVVLEGVAPDGREWLAAAVDSYQDGAVTWDVPFAAGGPPSWPRVEARWVEPLPDEGGIVRVGADLELPDAPRRPVPPTRVRRIRTSDDRISFDVDRVGTPVLVKTSYFPNWKADGADGPWRVTPNLMVVVPRERHVELRYGTTPVDGFAWLLTLGGLAGLVVLARRGPVDLARRRRRRSPEVAVGAGEGNNGAAEGPWPTPLPEAEREGAGIGSSPPWTPGGGGGAPMPVP